MKRPVLAVTGIVMEALAAAALLAAMAGRKPGAVAILVLLVGGLVCALAANVRGESKLLREIPPVFVITMILLAMFLPQHILSHHPRVLARNGHAVATLHDLGKALQAYKEDFGAFPAGPGGRLVADTRVFVSCLSSKGKKGIPFFSFRDDDLQDGQFTSPYGKPFYYTFPANGPGPDGVIHKNVEYYLWTWGGLGDGPEAEWEINNWGR